MIPDGAFTAGGEVHLFWVCLCASRVLIRQTTGQRDYYIDSGAAAVTTGGWSDLIITMTVMSQDS